MATNQEENQETINVWDKTVKAEENMYYWKGEPIITKGEELDKDKLLVVELFSGCGGTSLGFEMAGFQLAVALDILRPAIQTIRKNHPKCSTILGDVKKVTPETILELLQGRTVDVLIGGVPCQGFSLNNRKRSEGDERNFLYKEFIRFVEILKPRAVVIENVSGMKSTSNGDFVRHIETEIAKAGNLCVKSSMLFAPDYGVPQKRQRLVFVGLKDKEFDFNLVEKTNGEGTGKPYNTVKDAIGDLPSLKAGKKSIKYKTEAFSEYQKMMRQNAPIFLLNHEAPNHPQETIEKIRNTPQGKPMYPKFKQRIRLGWDILSPTQVSGGIRPQFQFGHPEDARGLTIRERCRLQSFPDYFELCGGIVQSRVQTGNAVPPLLAKSVALIIKKHLENV